MQKYFIFTNLVAAFPMIGEYELESKYELKFWEREMDIYINVMAIDDELFNAGWRVKLLFSFIFKSIRNHFSFQSFYSAVEQIKKKWKGKMHRKARRKL